MLGNLRALFGVIIDIALLRRGPESLPASTALMAGAIALNLSAWAIMLLLTPNMPRGAAILEVIVRTLVTLSCFSFAFRLVKKPERFQQSITAYFGASALFIPALIPVVGVLKAVVSKQDAEATAPFALVMIFAGLAFWMVAVQVRIARTAFEWPTFVSICFIIGQHLFAGLIVLFLFGVPAKTP